jgi:hypothetical protein
MIMLITTKTALNPRMKHPVTATRRGRFLASGAVPPRNRSHEGIRGSTQGDRKDKRPAPKENRIKSTGFNKTSLEKPSRNFSFWEILLTLINIRNKLGFTKSY